METDFIILLDHIDIFQKNILILSDITLKIKKSEFVYLIGKTGSGKSSILKVIYSDIPIKPNQIYPSPVLGEGLGGVNHPNPNPVSTARVGEYDLLHLKSKQIPHLRRKLGIVFQDFQLLTDRSVYNNLFFVLKATGWRDKLKMKDKINEVLVKVGLETKGFKMPHQLSGGEQQRVVIARALLNDPDIILADEPTGNLDPQTSDDIMNILFDISKSGRAVLMSTHNYSILQKFPSRIVKCDNSKIYENG